MQINILGIDYEVILTDQISNTQLLAGLIEYQNAKIQLNKDLAPDVLNQTFIHEVLHGIFDGLGLDEINNDEKAVQSIATALYCTFKDYFTFSFS